MPTHYLVRGDAKTPTGDPTPPTNLERGDGKTPRSNLWSMPKSNQTMVCVDNTSRKKYTSEVTKE